MSFLDPNRQASRNELRVFGLLFAAFCGLVGGLLWWQLDLRATPRAIWVFGVLCMVLYYALPPLQRPAVQAWTRLTYPLGWAISHLVLALVYFGIFTPLGLLMRLFGRDPLARKFDRSVPSYWNDHHPAEGAARYFRQF